GGDRRGARGRVGGGARHRAQQAHRSRSDHIFHRSSARRDPAAGCDAHCRRESRGSRTGNGLSGVAGSPPVSGRGDSARMMVLEAVELGKEYRGGDGGTITVLDGVNLQVARGEMLAVVGASGAGKSTLLHLLGALDEPTRGEVFINGIRLPGSRARAGSDVSSERNGSISGAGTAGGIQRLRDRRARRRLAGKRDLEVSALRNRSVGFVFQFHHLLREFTALENVAMPLRIAGWDEARAQKRAAELLERVGLGARTQHRPAELSGGEQQRSAVARALAIDPAVVLADEPSGNLDHTTSERLHDLFVELSRDLEIAMVIATHNRSLAARADRTLLLEDGRLMPADVRETVP